MEEKKKTTSNNSEHQQPLKSYVKYSGLGFQMVVLIGGGAWGGHALDNYWQLETPVMTIIGSFLGIASSFFILFRGLK